MNDTLRQSRALLIAVCVLGATSCDSAEETRQGLIESEAQSLEQAVAHLEKGNARHLRYSVWLGRPNGDAWYRHNSDIIRPGAVRATSIYV